MEQNMIEKFNVSGILKFTVPTILMMLCISVYTMVDGLFIANFISDEALSSTNIVFPVISILIGVGIMLGTGGNAIIARNLGAGQCSLARGQFSFIVIVGILMGFVLILVCVLFTEEIVLALGATEKLFDYSVEYLFYIMLASPFALLQLMFQTFFVTAGKPKLGLLIIALGGLANIVFDYLFIVVMEIGVKGASFGTAFAYIIPAVFGLVYFSVKRDGMLYFEKPQVSFKMLGRSCFNGLSEMVSNIATAVTTFLFNMMMLRFLGEDGVAAITIAIYLQFLMTAVFIGYSMGIAPVFSYNYGREDSDALKKLFKISMRFIAANSIVWFLISVFFRDFLIGVFTSSDSLAFKFATEGWYIFALSFLFSGVNIFASGMFTAFSDGRTSAIISFLRTLLFLSVFIIVLPEIFGSIGIWMAVPVAEVLTFAVALYYIFKLRSRYQYG